MCVCRVQVVHADSGLLLEYEKLLATASSVSADDQRDTGAVTVDVEVRLVGMVYQQWHATRHAQRHER